MVEIINPDGTPIGRGLIEADNQSIETFREQSARQPIIHRDNLVML